jgi:L-asparaginase II
MRSTTETLIAATRELAATIQCDDGAANAALSEVADRLAELQSVNASLVDALCELRDFAEVDTHYRYAERSKKAFESANRLLAKLERLGK